MISKSIHVLQMILFHSFCGWIIFHCKGFPGGSGVKNLLANSGFDPWVRRKIPWRRKWKPTAVSLLEKIPWTEEPGWLQSMGSQRVRHNWATGHTYRFSWIETFRLGRYPSRAGNSLWTLPYRWEHRGSEEKRPSQGHWESQEAAEWEPYARPRPFPTSSLAARKAAYGL